MDQTLPSLLPSERVDSITRSEADLAAGRLFTIDTDALCREIEADADAMERTMAAASVSPA